MEDPQQSQLVHWDKYRIPVNLTLLFSLGVTAFGLFGVLQGESGRLVLVFAGIAVAAYSWFTNPRQFRIYQDALVIVYGTPRTRTIPFSNVSQLEMRQLDTPDRLRLWPIQGRRVVLMVRDVQKFHDELQKALDDYRRMNPDSTPSESGGEFRET